MTDNEVIKALECCLDISPSNCKNCSLFNITNSTMVCSKIATKFALDLINRQQAEIERLKNILICFMGALGKVRNIDDIESISQIPLMTELNKGIRAEIKAEAYKECIKKVKNYIKAHCNPYGKPDFDYDTSIKILNFIDKLAKEMVGDDNA